MRDKNSKQLYSFYNIAGICVIILFISACLYLSSINNTLWFDGAYSLAMTKHSWREILEITANDFHPPLYYFILKAGYILFGSEVFTMRAVSIFPLVLLLLFVRRILLQNFGPYSFLLFSLAFFSSSTVVLYALEIRMYSWAMFFVTMTFLSAFNAIKTNSNKWFFILFVFFIATFYTHYYAGVLVGIGYIFLIIYSIVFNKKKTPILLLIALLSFLLYIPWLLIIIKQFPSTQNDFWITTFHWIDSFKFTLSLFSSGNLAGSILLLLAFVLSLFMFFYKKQKKTTDYFFFSGLLMLFCFIIFVTLLSLTIRPLFISRYLVPACGLLWLFFAIQLASSRTINPIKNLLPILLLGLAINSFLELKRIPSEEGYFRFQKKVSQKISSDDIIIISNPEVSGGLIGVVSYLLPNHIMAITNNRAIMSENLTLNYHTSPFKMRIIRFSDLKTFPSKKKWLLLPYNAKDKNLKKLTNGSPIIHRGNFGWIGYKSGYQFDLYEISPQN